MDADRATCSQLARSHIRGGLQHSVTLYMNKVSEAQKASSCRLPLPPPPPQTIFKDANPSQYSSLPASLITFSHSDSPHRNNKTLLLQDFRHNCTTTTKAKGQMYHWTTYHTQKITRAGDNEVAGNQPDATCCKP